MKITKIRFPGRINFVKNEMHYSIRTDYDDNYRTYIWFKCKETGKGIILKDVHEFIFYFDWEVRKKGNTYKTYPIEKLAEYLEKHKYFEELNNGGIQIFLPKK